MTSSPLPISLPLETSTSNTALSLEYINGSADVRDNEEANQR